MRIRTVKPEFWQSETMASVSREVRMFAVALLNWADDDGYFRSNPTLIAGSLLPYDKDGAKFSLSALGALRDIGFLQLGDDGVGFIVNFARHQVINRPTPSKLKERFKFSENSVRTHGGLTEGSGSGSGSGSGEMSSKPDLSNVAQVFDYWRQKVAPRARVDTKRERLIQARLGEGFTVADLRSCVDGYVRSPFHQGQNDRHKKFLGLDLMFRDAAHVEQGLELAGEKKQTTRAVKAGEDLYAVS